MPHRRLLTQCEDVAGSSLCEWASSGSQVVGDPAGGDCCSESTAWPLKFHKIAL